MLCSCALLCYVFILISLVMEYNNASGESGRQIRPEVETRIFGRIGIGIGMMQNCRKGTRQDELDNALKIQYTTT